MFVRDGDGRDPPRENVLLHRCDRASPSESANGSENNVRDRHRANGVRRRVSGVRRCASGGPRHRVNGGRRHRVNGDLRHRVNGALRCGSALHRASAVPRCASGDRRCAPRCGGGSHSTTAVRLKREIFLLLFMEYNILIAKKIGC